MHRNFCPIKHARKIPGTHRRHVRFPAFGDADGYEEKLARFRSDLGRLP